MSNNFINGTCKLKNMLCILFNLFISHGFTTFNFNSSIILPLPKNFKKSLSSSNNYRAISLNVILCKIFEYIIRNLLQKYIETSDYQFGYKKNLSTTMCSFITTESIKYYLNSGSNVFALFLDASKAFDKVKHDKMFKMLVDYNICPLLLRMIMVMYENGNAKVKWNNNYSEIFKIRNGVKQGGVLSPFLFSIYLDPLINKIKNSGYGCHIGETPYNIAAYADDIVLLTPTIKSLKILINFCENYSKEYALEFNSNKSKIMIFSNNSKVRNSKPSIKLNGDKLEITNNYCHLGINIENENKHNLVKFDNIVRDLYVKTNSLINEFKKQTYMVKTKLFNTLCMPLYGCELWDNQSTDYKNIQVCWRKCCRAVLNLPKQTHNNLIPELINSPPIEYIISTRFLNFFLKGTNSKTPQLIKNIFYNSLLSESSNYKRRINHACNINSIKYFELFNNARRIKPKYTNVIEKWKIGFIKEVLMIKDNNLQCFLT